MDWRALSYAILVEIALLIPAAFGGPHGYLGVIPWTLQLPGILLIMYLGGGEYFALRVITAAVVQVSLWYLALRLWRRWKMRKPTE